MAIEAQDLLDSLDEINIEGGHWIRQQKKAAFKALVDVAAKDYPPGKVTSGTISEAYKKAILDVLKNHAEVFAFEAHELDEIKNISSLNITQFEEKLLLKYRTFFNAGVDLQQLKEVSDAEIAKLDTVAAKDPVLDAEINLLLNKLEILKKDSAELKAKEDEIKLAKVALEDQSNVVAAKDLILEDLKKQRSGLTGRVNKNKRKLLNKRINNERTAKDIEQEQHLNQEEILSRLSLEKEHIQNLIKLKHETKQIDKLIEEKNELLSKKTKELPQNTPSVVALNNFNKILVDAISAEQNLSSSDLKSIIQSGEDYDQAIQKLRSFEKIKDNHLTEEVKQALKIAFKPKTKIELSSGTAFQSNLVMSLSDEIDPWDISKCLDIPESFTELPVNLKSQNAAEYNSEQNAQGETHVFVRAAPEYNDSPAECIVAKKEFDLRGGKKQLVVLKQEVAGSKVTNLTEGMSSLDEKDQIKVAMMHAKMLLDNYKPGYTNITIKMVDSKMAEKVHAALLVMKGDSAAKLCTIENKNPDSKLPGAMESLTGSFCKEILGKNIYDDYKSKYRSEMISHKKAMKFEFSKKDNGKEYTKPEGGHPGVRPSK